MPAIWPSSPTLPIALWDERLSTAAVERALIAADASRAKRKAVIDQHAATYILQGALDRLAHAAQGHRTKVRLPGYDSGAHRRRGPKWGLPDRSDWAYSTALMTRPSR